MCCSFFTPYKYRYLFTSLFVLWLTTLLTNKYLIRLGKIFGKVEDAHSLVWATPCLGSCLACSNTYEILSWQMGHRLMMSPSVLCHQWLFVMMWYQSPIGNELESALTDQIPHCSVRWSSISALIFLIIDYLICLYLDSCID